MAVEALAWQLSGCLVREIDPNGAVARDCRIRPGDLVLAVNYESIWRVTSSQAKTILRRADLMSGEIPLIFIPEEALIEEEELATPEFGDINTEFGSSYVLNPVDTETEPESTDVEAESEVEENDFQVGQSIVGSFRLSDIQEQLEETESICSNSLLVSSPSCASGILAPDFSVQSVKQHCTFASLRLEDLPESRVDSSPEISSPEQSFSAVHQSGYSPHLTETEGSKTPSPHVTPLEQSPIHESPKVEETSSVPKTEENPLETETDRSESHSRNLSESGTSHKVPGEQDFHEERNLLSSVQLTAETSSQSPVSISTPQSPPGALVQNAEVREPDLIQHENKELGLSDYLEQIESRGSFDPTEQISSQVSFPRLEGEVKSSSGLALEDLRLQHYEKKLPQKDVVPNCDTPEVGNTIETELESKIRLVSVTSGSLDEKPYKELNQESSMTARRNSLNLCNNKNSHDDLPSPSVGVSAKFWGPKRLVEVWREPGQPLGIAIVGGKVDMAGQSGQPGDSVLGIFIKNVLANSPAGRTGQLATGDRIVEVDGVKLRSSDHELAVKAIQGAGNPINFVVQSLQHWSCKDMKTNHAGQGTSQPSKITSALSVDAAVMSNSPSKLIIPDIFCVSPRPTNGPTVNGLSTSSSIRSDSSLSIGPNHSNQMTSILEPDFNERRHSESVVKSRQSQPGLAQIGRPKSETHSSSTPPIDEGERPNLNGNPFLNDRLPVWQDDSCSVLSSPEGVQDQSYNYNYKTVPEVPSTPELQEMRKTSNNGGVHIAVNDFNSFRSNASGQSSCPPTPVLIQKGLSDGEKQVIYNQLEAVQNQTATKGEESGVARQKQKKDNVEECVLVEDQLMGKAAYHRKSSIEHNEGIDEFSEDENEMEEENWGNLQGEVISLTLEQNNYGLGLSLAGHKDRETMRTYICGIHPRGMAHQSGLLKAGDQLLKVGDHVVWDRCHLNVTTIIKNMSSQEKIALTVLRDEKSVEQVSVKPVTHYPLLLDDMIFESGEFKKFRAKRELRVHKGRQGLGIMIIEGSHKATGNGIFVSDIQEKSAAFHSGLKVGDMILAINTETFIQISYDEAVSIIKSLGGNVKMLVTNPKEEDKCQAEAEAKPALMPRRESLAPSPAKVVKAAPVTNTKSPAKAAEKTPAKVEVKAEVKAEEKPKKDDTKVEIVKDGSGLGLSIVGGGDTPLGGVFIHEIHSSGPAEKGGKLKAGDQIVKVNDVDFRNLTHKEALNALRSAQDKVVLHFERKEETAPENIYQDISVTLIKKSGKGLGLSVVGRRDGPGVFISALVAGGVADTNGQLLQGDQIIKVNESDLSSSTQDAAVAILKTASGDVNLVVRRLKILTKTT